jgi:hypothetical protein
MNMAVFMKAVITDPLQPLHPDSMRANGLLLTTHRNADAWSRAGLLPT